jgi:hypothetical protein
MGHADRFAPPSPNGGCRFDQGTLAETDVQWARGAGSGRSLPRRVTARFDAQATWDAFSRGPTELVLMWSGRFRNQPEHFK